MKIKIWVVALGLAISLSRISAATEHVEEGFAEYNCGDCAAALQNFRRAAEQGDAHAQFRLGSMYERALGVPQDYMTALKWYRLAADQGNAAAQLRLGVMYIWSLGVPQDLVQAHMWFNLAAIDPRLATAVRNRDFTAKRMTPFQVLEAQRRARDWIAAHPKP